MDRMHPQVTDAILSHGADELIYMAEFRAGENLKCQTCPGEKRSRRNKPSVFGNCQPYNLYREKGAIIKIM